MMNNNCSCNMNMHQALINIDELSFALVDTLEYLDTHPDDTMALKFYCDTLHTYKERHEAFSKQFYPLTMCDINCNNGFDWGMAPCPWELEAN